MTWNAYHHRGEILHSVVATADARCDGILPMDVPGVSENFTDELDLLSALMLKWHARLSGNVERELMNEPLDLELTVARAWRRTADQMPGIRRIIDRCTETPATTEMAAAVSVAQEREWVRLAAAAGLANDEGRAAARAGQRVEMQARVVEVSTIEPIVVQANETPGPSFVSRIRAVLAA